MPAFAARVSSLAIAILALACGPTALLGGARHFEEIDVAEAARRLALERVHLIQVREPDSGDPRIDGAEIVGPDQPLPDPSSTDGMPLLLIGRDDRAVRRHAARLVRGGYERVVAVRGGIQPWRDRRHVAPEIGP